VNEGQKEKGAEMYVKAGELNEKDEFSSSEALYRAAMTYELMGKKEKAVAVLKTLKEKYPSTERGYQAEKYLARLGYISND
jgi:TolA-binding protein